MNSFSAPFPQSYRVRELLLFAGHYPGDMNDAERDRKLLGLLRCGIRHVINLMECDERAYGKPFAPYQARLNELAAPDGGHVECLRYSTSDAHAPDPALLRDVLDRLRDSERQRIPTYLHCWGGHGRTSTVVACLLIENGMTADEAIASINGWRSRLPKNHYPFENEQEEFVRAWQYHALYRRQD